jgi:phage shock protein PspC (stress-responsive transcriptional regulator)
MGVCGGIASSTGVASVWIRLATVAAAILLVPGPSFLIVGGAYVALGYLLPEADEF